MADRDPQDREIAQAIQQAGEGGVEPAKLVEALAQTYSLDNVIEALQRAIERGKIQLNNQGMVVCLDRDFAHAA